MSKLSMLRKAAGLTTKEEETKEDQPVTENLKNSVEEAPKEEIPVEEVPVVNSEETPVNGTPVVETPENETPTEETPVVEAQDEIKPEFKELTEETLQDENTTDTKEENTDDPKPKRRSKRSSARDSKDSPDEPKDDPKKEGDQETTEAPKRGRKKGVRRDRVIVMLDKETIEVLDSFSISRSGTARAVILASQDFLAGLEGEITEDELVAKIKEKLA